jgi:hypothetical protein
MNLKLSKTFINQSMFLISIIVVGFVLAIFLPNFQEGFMNTDGEYPVSVDKPILNDYKPIGVNDVSKNSASSIWKNYPIFSLPSYKQITNNLRYNKNPDNGTCTRPEFCGAIYHNKSVPSNEVQPLPPAEEGTGARVGYFRSEPNELWYSIPTNENILY